MSKNKQKYIVPTYEKGLYGKLSEFRYNNSRAGGGHPNYIFGWKNDRYLSLGITDQPNSNYLYHPLSRSPNPSPKNQDPNYLRIDKIYNDKTELYGKKTLHNWSFADSDKKVVNSVIKKYNKKIKYSNKVFNRKKKSK